MLTDQQVARMRETVNRTFPDEIQVYRLARVYDGGGGYKEDWLPEGDPIPCRVGLPLGGETDERAASRVRLADEDLQTVWLAADSDIRKTDQIEWEGRMYEVYAVLVRGNWELARRIRIKEL